MPKKKIVGWSDKEVRGSAIWIQDIYIGSSLLRYYRGSPTFQTKDKQEGNDYLSIYAQSFAFEEVPAII